MLWLPDSRLEQPIVLSPGRMPVAGQWMLDPTHKYAKNMTICHVPFIRYASGQSWRNAVDLHNYPMLEADYRGPVGGLADIIDRPSVSGHLIGKPATFRQEVINEVFCYRSQFGTDNCKPFTDGASFTLMGIGRLRRDFYAYTDTDARIFTKDYGVGTDEHTAMIGITRPSSGNAIRARFRNTDGSTATIVSGTWDYDVPLMICGGYDGSRLYCDGIVGGTLQEHVQHTTAATFVDNLSNTKMAIAGVAGDLDPTDAYRYIWGGEIWAIYGWNKRYINRSQMLDIYRNPYQMFIPVS